MGDSVLDPHEQWLLQKSLNVWIKAQQLGWILRPPRHGNPKSVNKDGRTSCSWRCSISHPEGFLTFKLLAGPLRCVTEAPAHCVGSVMSCSPVSCLPAWSPDSVWIVKSQGCIVFGRWYLRSPPLFKDGWTGKVSSAAHRVSTHHPRLCSNLLQESSGSGKNCLGRAQRSQ